MTQQHINQREQSHHGRRNESTDAGASDQDASQYTCPMHPEVVSDQSGDCPKCGMHLVPVGSDDSQTHDGHGHGASAPAHGGKYDKVPAGHAEAVYTCPMHPEVRQTKPGACPLCGMGLELESAAVGDEGPNPELVDFTRRFWVAVVLTVPVLVLTMSPYLGLTAVRDVFGERTSLWIELVLSTPVILWSGWPFFVRGWNSFRTMNLNMFSLIGMGVGAAYLFSIVAVLVMTGFLLQWPTLLTLVMFPVLVWMYSRLAIHEEREVARRFGEAWQAYATHTPRFIPQWRTARTSDWRA